MMMTMFPRRMFFLSPNTDNDVFGDIGESFPSDAIIDYNARQLIDEDKKTQKLDRGGILATQASTSSFVL